MRLSLTLLLRLTPPDSRTSFPSCVRANPQSPFPPDHIIHVAFCCGKNPLFSLNRPLGLYFQLRLLVLLRAWVNPNRPLTHSDQSRLISDKVSGIGKSHTTPYHPMGMWKETLRRWHGGMHYPLRRKLTGHDACRL